VAVAAFPLWCRRVHAAAAVASVPTGVEKERPGRRGVAWPAAVRLCLVIRRAAGLIARPTSPRRSTACWPCCRTWKRRSASGWRARVMAVAAFPLWCWPVHAAAAVASVPTGVEKERPGRRGVAWSAAVRLCLVIRRAAGLIARPTSSRRSTCLLAVLSNLEAPPGPLAGAPELPVAAFSLCCLAAVVSIFRPGVVAGDRGDPDRRS